jgi:hypothetical protein
VSLNRIYWASTTVFPIPLLQQLHLHSATFIRIEGSAPKWLQLKIGQRAHTSSLELLQSSEQFLPYPQTAHSPGRPTTLWITGFSSPCQPGPTHILTHYCPEHQVFGRLTDSKLNKPSNLRDFCSSKILGKLGKVFNKACFTPKMRSRLEILSRALAHTWKADYSTWQPLDVV